MRGLVLSLGLALSPLLGAGVAQAESLADIRAELQQLSSEISGLNNELISTGAVARPGGADMLARIETLESELMRLTGRTEELDLRIKKIVKDGTNRVGDLEFRITELEGGDVSNMPPTRELGADRSETPSAPAAAAPASPKPNAAAGEQAELNRAREVLGQGDFRRAADLLETYAASWPNSELTGEVLFLKGEALDGLGDTAQAARSYLDSFTGYPQGPRGAESLFRLGRNLGRLGQMQEACITLGEVAIRYPGDTIVSQAEAERSTLVCP